MYSYYTFRNKNLLFTKLIIPSEKPIQEYKIYMRLQRISLFLNIKIITKSAKKS